MVALNQQFTALATLCSLAAMSLFPLSANAVAIQQRARVNDGKPSRHGSPATPFPAVNHKSRKGKQHKGRALPWSPVSHVLRMAGITTSSSKRHHHNNAVDVDIPGAAEITINKRHGDEAQAYFHQIRNSEAHVSHRDYTKRRSSVAIPSNRGGSYILSPGRRSLHAGQGKTTKRGEKPEGVPGRVDIMSPVHDSPKGKKLASLFMQMTTNHTYVLNASDTNSTRMDLVNAPPGISSFSMPSGQDSEVPVYLQFPFFDPSQPDIVLYCATINGKAASAEPQPMTVEKCFDKAQGNSVDQKSQTFAYDGKSGTIRPMWFVGQEGGKSDDPSTPNNAGAAGVTNVIGGRDEAGVSAKNVTLVFVPDAPEVVNAEEDIVTATSTMTTTITVTSMSTATSSASVADVDPTSTVEASVTLSGVPFSSSIPSSTTKSSMVTSTPVASAAAFNVQVVGLNNTSSSDPIVASTTSTSNSTVRTTSVAAQAVSSSSFSASTTITSDSTTPTTSINAADIAASIAATDVSLSAAHTSTVTPKATSSTAVSMAAAVESPLTSAAASSSAPTMTPVSTAPYQMVFKADSRL